MAAQLKMPVVSIAADGASTEVAAQLLLDGMPSDLPPLTYEYPQYGISVKAVNLPDTGPFAPVTDPEHAKKTTRNQPQHGTHTASLGTGYLVNGSLVDLSDVADSGLKRSDVVGVDKQDDGAARRLFHHKALLATTFEKDGVRHVLEKFIGTHFYLFIHGMSSMFSLMSLSHLPFRRAIRCVDE